MSMTGDYFTELEAKVHGWATMPNVSLSPPKCLACAMRDKCVKDKSRARECKAGGYALFVPSKGAGRALSGPIC